MSRGVLRESELLVLGALAGFSEWPYGLELHRAIAQRTGRELAIGSVYRCLTSLERKGYVASRTGEPTPVRGGRAKRHFGITANGCAAFQRTIRDLKALTEGVELGWGDA